MLDLDGYIATSSQVIQGQPAQLQVIFSGGADSPASIVGTDNDTGIAVLKVASVDIPGAPTYAAASRVATGDDVISLGTALSDLQRTADIGTVNAVGRKEAIVAGQLPVDNLIQSDAVAPGGSLGGPVVTVRGELVGLTVVRADAKGMWSLVLPAGTVRDIAKRLKTAALARVRASVSPIRSSRRSSPGSAASTFAPARTSRSSVAALQPTACSSRATSSRP
ncbi:MAG: serine protease [Chloroflexia bacterium]